MKIAILEDENIVADDIAQRIRSASVFSDRGADITIFSDGESLIASKMSFDVIFVDYQLGGGKNGMDTVKVIRQTDPDVKVVFLTNYPEYVFESFKVNTFRYLVKPVADEDLEEALGDLVDDDYSNMVITAGKKGELSHIKVSDIMYVESSGRNSWLYTLDGSVFINKNITYLEKLFPDMFFCRINRCSVLNFEYMTDTPTNTKTMADGKKINVSRTRRAEFKKKYLRYLKHKK